MSLQLLAKQMEAKGRGGDSLLVHMTPEEVAGLQKLAESAGGSLSVNPETGLVEANFLKRMLPTLVGIGVGAFAGPVAGAAAGAAVGGYQAKRNDQDVGMGMLMGGLGGYGGGTMGAGLTAAGAAAPAAAGATAAPMTASQSLSQAGQGLTALGTDAAKRAAFAKSVGMSGVGMAAAPMMAPERAAAPTPTDDEMYSYTFNPGRTGAEKSPSATSAEREYFQSSYSPMRRIRANEYPVYAAQGGLMSLAEGGETAAPTAAEVAVPSASEAALAYLMGERSSSAGLPAVRAPSTPASNIGVGGDNMYAFDPVTGTFLRNPNVAGATSDAVRGPVGQSFAGSGGDSYQPAAPNPDFDTPEKQAAYYAENPTMGAITRAGQSVFGYTGLGRVQEAMNPGFAEQQRDITFGGSLSPGSVNDKSITAGLGAIGYDDSAPDMSVFDNSSSYDSGSSNQSYNFSGDDSMDFGSEAQGGPIGNQDFGGGFDYGGSYDSYSSDSYSGGGGYSPTSYDSSYGGFFAQGGIASLAKGGMASGGFVVPADVVSALGNGSTDAGLRKLSAMMGDVKPIKGKGDGLSDSIPTNIDGKQPARVADGEAYIDPKTVKRLGGAKKLYAMMDKVRAQAHGKTTQQRKVNPARVMA